MATAAALSLHFVLFPGLAIMLTVLGFNLLGDGLQDVSEPRLEL
jgi:peptide/nickel transport system permease protein